MDSREVAGKWAPSPLGEICYALEQKGREGDANNLETHLTSLEQEYARAHVALEAQLANLLATST